MTYQNVLFDPTIFHNPDRWTSSADESRRLDRYLVTFSKGNGLCLGINLAESEMYLCIAALASRVDLELSDFDQKRELDMAPRCFVELPTSEESKGVGVEVESIVIVVVVVVSALSLRRKAQRCWV